MAVNKVDVNGSTVLDLTNDSVTPETLTLGSTAHNAAGEQITGTYEAPVTSVNEQTGDVVVTAESIGAQQKLYNLTLDTPIVENQTINPNSTYTFSSPITLNEYEVYWIDVQAVYEGKVQNRHQLLSRAVNGDSGITVQWRGYIILDTTGVTLNISSNGTYIITIAKVLDYERPVDSTITHQEGEWCIASCTTAHVEGSNTVAFGECSHAEGQDTTASSDGSHSEGIRTTASGSVSHAEGYLTTASGGYSHAEGSGSNTLPDTITPDSTIDDIIAAHNESPFSLAMGIGSHVEGGDNLALGGASHAEGAMTIADGDQSHTEGLHTRASTFCSHAEGQGTKASSEYQHVQGKYNIEDSSNTYAHIVGNGDGSFRSNAHTLDWSGNAWYAGTVEGKALILPSSTENSTKKFKITVNDSGTLTATEVT